MGKMLSQTLGPNPEHLLASALPVERITVKEKSQIVS